jgi:hypothetical protein
MLGMCYILCTTRCSVCCVASDAQGGCRGQHPPCTGVGGQRPREFFLPRETCHIFALFFVSIVGQLFNTWFLSMVFLFLVKELGLLTNPCHCVRILDAIGSYMHIVL